MSLDIVERVIDLLEKIAVAPIPTYLGESEREALRAKRDITMRRIRNRFLKERQYVLGIMDRREGKECLENNGAYLDGYYADGQRIHFQPHFVTYTMRADVYEFARKLNIIH